MSLRIRRKHGVSLRISRSSKRTKLATIKVDLPAQRRPNFFSVPETLAASARLMTDGAMVPTEECLGVYG